MIIKSSIRRFREHVVEGGQPNSSLAIGLLLREIASKNSDVMLSIREAIDQIEEKSLEEAGKKHAIYSIFSLKRKISTINRLLITEKEIMLDINETMIPHIKLDEKAKSIVDNAIENINREIDFIDSYNRSLDSILTLQDLASIHRVESSINYLTMPGFTDTKDEYRALKGFIEDLRIDMIQWRNLNFDPARYFRDLRINTNYGEMLGIRDVINSLKARFPKLIMGYFNPSRARIKRNMT